MKPSHKWAFGIAVVSALLTVAGHIGVLEWYKADVRYEEGSWYHSADQSLTSLKLTNFGHADAEQVKVSAIFEDSIREATSSREGFPLTTNAGGKGFKTITGTIERMVPDQTLYIYFATDRQEVTTSSRSFVDTVIFNGGTGRPDTPSSRGKMTQLTTWVLAVVGMCVIPPLFLITQKLASMKKG